MSNIDELLEIEKMLYKLSRELYKKDLKNEDKKSLEDLYGFLISVERKQINSLEFKTENFISYSNYLKENFNLDNIYNNLLFNENVSYPATRLLYRLKKVGIENAKKEDIMDNIVSENNIYTQVFNKESNLLDKKISEKIYGTILLEEQLARLSLYNLEKYLNDETLSLKHNLSYIYGYQDYNDDLAIIQSDVYCKFYKTSAIAYAKVSSEILTPLVNKLINSLEDDNSITNIKRKILLESSLTLLDVRSQKKIEVSLDEKDKEKFRLIKKTVYESFLENHIIK